MDVKRVLFIDRDGTVIVEPPDTCQVDSLEKLEFIPLVFRNLYLITKLLDYELVMVSNQDGLGTPAYPAETFNLVQGKLIAAFKNEGINFQDILIDTSLPEENKPTRKPGTGLLKKYLSGDYDLSNSFVIGDRLTDIELARNLGCQGILIGSRQKKEELIENNMEKHCVLVAEDWDQVYRFLRQYDRKSVIERSTSETEVKISLVLDGTGESNIRTGLGFFDHLLGQIAKHSRCNLLIDVKGDLHVDEHHTIEDTALALGEAFYNALGSGKGISRYGFTLPMDDSLVTVAIDLGGRNWLEWDVEFRRERIGDVPTEMFYHFFKSFTDTAKCNLHVRAEGQNEHHKIEAIFKAFAKSLAQAFRQDLTNDSIPSTKGKI